MTLKVAFQGELGAYSHQACVDARPGWDPMPVPTFEDAVDAVLVGTAENAVLPVENSTYGRVADIHELLPDSNLHIIDEVLVPIRINLLAIPGARLSEVRLALSHMVLLGQCRQFCRQHGIQTLPWADTAGAAKRVADDGDRTRAALASELAGEIYGLETLANSIEEEKFNKTRFIVMSRDRQDDRRGEFGMITSFVFRVRNLPAALYKALGGFATNSVNIVRLESHMLGGSFNNTQFFADLEGHPEDPGVERALDELKFFTNYMKILGVYPASAERSK